MGVVKSIPVDNAKYIAPSGVSGVEGSPGPAGGGGIGGNGSPKKVAASKENPGSGWS